MVNFPFLQNHWTLPSKGKVAPCADLLSLSRKTSLLESISCTLRSSIEALFSKSGMRKRFWSNKKRLTRGSVNPGSQENYLQALGYIRSKFCVARLVPNLAGSSQYTLLEQRIWSGKEFTCIWPNLHVESLYPPDIQTSIASVWQRGGRCRSTYITTNFEVPRFVGLLSYLEDHPGW